MYAIRRLRENAKGALRLGYRATVGRSRRYGQHDDGSPSTEMSSFRAEPVPLPSLGYDQTTIDWAVRLLRDGDPTAPFPPADPIESQSDAVRLRGVFAYLSQLSGVVEPDIIDARLAVLLQATVRAIDDHPGIGWDTTNAALRLISLLEGMESLARVGRYATATTLISERFLRAHGRALRAGTFHEPCGNHEAVNALGFAALDMLLRPSTELSERRIRHVQRILEAQLFPDGGHMERCPYYHLQLCSALNTILAADTRRTGVQVLKLGMLHDRLRTALSSMVVSSATVPARFGDISRLWSGHRAEADVERELGELRVSDATVNEFLPDFGVIKAGWWARDHYVELIADVGPFGLRANAGHAHDDCLTYCLYVDGVEVIADPGVFRYTDDQASIWFKLAAAHNTVHWPNGEGPVPRRFFHWRFAPSREQIVVSHSPESIRAQRRAYCRGTGHVLHHRTWTLLPTGIVVRDRILANRFGRCIDRLNVGPLCRLNIERSGQALVVLTGGIPCLRLHWRGSAGVAVAQVPSRYAARYGEESPSDALEWSLPRDVHGWSINVCFELL